MLDLILTTEPAATLFKVTLLLAIALVGHRALRDRSAAARHLWAVLAIGALVAIPVLSMALPSWSVTLPADAPAATAPTITVAPAARFQAPRTETAAPPVRTTSNRIAPSTVIWPPRSFEVEPSRAVPAVTPETRPWTLLELAGLAWLSVALLLLGRLGLGAHRVLSWIRRSEEPADPRLQSTLNEVTDRLGTRRPVLRISDGSRVPLLWGCFRPVLLLPRAAESWTGERLRLVLTHEIAHLERGDWLTLLLGRIAVALYWFHPLAWYLESQARRDCEEACDDRVLALGTRASDYASHLLDLAQGLDRAPSPAVALLRPSQVEQRLRAILHPTRIRRSPSRRFGLIAAGVLTLVLVPLASVRLEAWDPGLHQGPALLGSTTSDSMDVPFEVDSTVDWHHEPSIDRELDSVFERAAYTVHSRIAQVFHSPDDDAYERRSEVKWRKRAPEDGEDWFDLAYDYHREEQYEKAIQAFQEAFAAGYRTGTSAYNAACGLARLGQTRDALDWLERSLTDGFDSFDHLFEDSDLDSLRAEPAFHEILDRYRETVGWKMRPAQDRRELAERDYELLVSSGSEDGDRWHKVGTTLLSLGEYDRAIECLERSVELDPHRSSTTRYNLACAFSRAGHTSQALEALDRAVEWGFDSEERFENDRDLDAIRGTARFEEIRAKADVLSLDRFRKGSWFRGDSRSDSRIDPETWEPAVATYQSYLERYPQSGRGWFNLGYALHYSGRHQDAIEAFDRALDLDFKPYLQMYNIACAHARLGRVDSALDWLQRSAEAGMRISHHMDEDPDFDAIRSDERFQELEREAWAEDQRRMLIEKKEYLERKLRELGSRGDKAGSRAELEALRHRLEAEEWTHGREHAREAERVRRDLEIQARQLARSQARVETKVRERQARQAEELARRQAELEARSAEHQAELHARSAERLAELQARSAERQAELEEATLEELARMQADLEAQQAELERQRAALEAQRAARTER